MTQSHETQLTVTRTLLESLVPRNAAASEEFYFTRPDDQLRLRFKLINGAIDRDRNVIVGLLGEEPIYYEIWLGPQHRVEAPIALGGQPPDTACASRIAGESRIVVEIPDQTPFTVTTLLDLGAYALVLDARASRGAPNKGDEPEASVTAIEVPTSLVLSPTPIHRFVAATQPITRSDVTELWRARLARYQKSAIVEPPDGQAKVRAIWSRKEDPKFVPPRPLDSVDRDLLVSQTTGKGGIPISVKQLWLSSHGAFFDAEGEWASGTLAAYRQRVITGRDLHVEVVKRGFLTPFGHRASITTLTERKFIEDESGETTAVLTQEEFLTVDSVEVALNEASFPYIPHEGRGTPFVAIVASDPGSGTIGAREVRLANGASIDIEKGHVITRNGEDVRIAFTATDRSDRPGIEFEMPVVFLTDDIARQTGNGTSVAILTDWLAEASNSEFAVAQMHAQAIDWADPPADVSNSRAGSTQTTNSISFGLDLPDIVKNDKADVEAALEASGRPAFYPAVRSARVVDVAASTSYGGNPPEAEVTVAKRYLDHGSSADNLDLGYLDLAVPNIVTPTTAASGMMSLNLNVASFGQIMGGGVDASGGFWDPHEALADLLGDAPKLLGNISLANIIGSVNLKLDLSDKGLPTLSVEPLFGVGDLPTGACFHFEWEPQLNSFPQTEGKDKTFVVTSDFGGVVPEIPADSFGDRVTRALVDSRTCTDGTQTFEISLERFALLLPPGLPAVALLFERLRYQNVQGAGSITTDLGDWFFINQLGWLEPVKDLLLNTLGLGTPMFEGGVFIDFDLPVPGLTLGVVNVHGIQLGLDINLPDNDPSSIGFALSSQEDPFAVTILGFGGNGSFALVVDSGRIVYVQGTVAVAFELAVDVFVVAASISVALGFYVIYEEPEVSVAAYATVSGSVSIIGLVKISGAVTIALIYNVTSKVLRGVATVTGEVDAVVFKGSVTRDVEVEVALADGSEKSVRRLAAAPAANDDASASFGDRYDESQWSRYCKAFAA